MEQVGVGRAGASATAVTSVDEAIDQMRHIDSTLPPRDGMRPFNAMYLAVTSAVQQSIASGFFADSAFLARLDVVFANRYFAALDAAFSARPLPLCWDALWRRRDDAGVTALQFAVAGMNAHINHDLVLAVDQTRREFGDRCDHAVMRADFFRVNALLAGLDGTIRRSFETGLLLRCEAWAGGAENHVCGWAIDAARAAAWADSDLLYSTRDHPVLHDRYERGLDRAVAAVGRALLAPLKTGRHWCSRPAPHLAGGSGSGDGRPREHSR